MTNAAIVGHYMTDWKIAKKGETLTIISHMIEEEVANNGDFELAEKLCDEIRYLIVISDIIPEEVKKPLTIDINLIKKGFAELRATYKKK